MSRRSGIAFFTLGALTALPALSSATTDPPTSLDARAMGMGSTSVAHVHSGAAVYHNAAALHEVETLTLTAALAANRVSQSAPLLMPNTSVDNEPATIPLFLVGGAYRVMPKLVLGLAAYTTGGFGSTYDTPAGEFKTTLGAAELSPVVAYSLTDTFAIGLGYRITYAMQEVEIPGLPAGPPATKLELSGLNFAGFHAGLYFRPMDRLKLGLAYRSKVTVELDGTTTVGATPVTPEREVDTTSEFAFPHAFKLGAAFEALEDTLVLAGELRYLMHGEANEEIVIETDMGEQPQTLDWEDSIGIGLGAEYFVLPILPLRAGYAMILSATPEERPAPFVPAPGPQHSIHLGAGVRLPSIDLDAAGFYSFGGKDIESDDMTVLPGEYKMSVVSLGLSVTYHQ